MTKQEILKQAYARPDGGGVLYIANIVENGDMMERIYDYLHARGCTPQARGAI
jgi:hypothetical protein